MQKRSHAGLNIIFLVLCIVACITTVVAFQANPVINAKPSILLFLSVGLDILLITLYAMYIRHYISISDDEDQFERQAYTDAMTQVKNRAAFNLAAEQLNPSACPNLTLIMADLNNLKQVNDTLGHMMGDKLICALVNCLKESFGHMGSIYRYGGDEFIVLIEKAELKEVQAAHTCFEQLVHEHSMHGGLEIFVAVGMASRQDPQSATLHAMELLIIADNAMYQYKAAQKAARAASEPAHRRKLEQIDPTTGILSFPAFKERLYGVLHSETPAYSSIINFDLNFYESYNATLGWTAENQLLQQMTVFAMSLCGEKGFCAHAEADSFWIFADFPDLNTLTDRISENTGRLKSKMGDFAFFPCFGIYVITDRLATVSDMCSRASGAKNTIKGRLDTLYHVYSHEDQQRRIANMRFTASLQGGFKAEEFTASYQPRFSCAENEIVGAEAIVHRKKDGGVAVSPDQLMSLYEKSGMILALDWHMIETVCRFLRAQLTAGRNCLPVSVSFSILHAFESGCIDRLLQLTDRYQIPHSLLEIEIARTSLSHNGAEHLPTLVSDLDKHGFPVHLTGVNSLVMTLTLQDRMPAKAIVLDRALLEVSNMTESNRIILSHALSLCRELSIPGIIKGVETQEQLSFLKSLGCHFVQGSLLSDTLSEKEFEHLLSRLHS